ncbi:probable serine hydrolase [Toxorhynchites rutilus septentrionalis]|uniref:probable serine hydrolase n=1 Tax=Toxorhynchites rutilus septentrionalis TaxID=329112 RepID=UPI00247AC05E|nr:probable serine hydrolase [Toxorhynchites rutilus septentrionalis]
MSDVENIPPSLINLVNQHDRDHGVQEVRIQLPFGEIAGKWWGPQNIRPILCLHGWQDNAGSFDTLIPLLPKHISFLALDFPGHGYSSRIPDGLTYQGINSISLLLAIMAEYGWKKVSFLSHSMGAVFQFVFAALFPNKVDLMISLDSLKPQVLPPEFITSRLSDVIPQHIVADLRNQQKSEPPSYTYAEMVERLHEATFHSISRECCPYLLHRNMKKSMKYPEKYYFTRDSRLKYHVGLAFSQDVCLSMAKQLTMPFLFIKATQSPYFEDKRYYDQVVDVLKAENPFFVLRAVKGKHHVHLTEPERVAPVVTDFLLKYWIKDEDIVSKL